MRAVGGLPPERRRGKITGRRMVTPFASVTVWLSTARIRSSIPSAASSARPSQQYPAASQLAYPACDVAPVNVAPRIVPCDARSSVPMPSGDAEIVLSTCTLFKADATS